MGKSRSLASRGEVAEKREHCRRISWVDPVASLVLWTRAAWVAQHRVWSMLVTCVASAVAGSAGSIAPDVLQVSRETGLVAGGCG